MERTTTPRVLKRTSHTYQDSRSVHVRVFSVSSLFYMRVFSVSSVFYMRVFSVSSLFYMRVFSVLYLFHVRVFSLASLKDTQCVSSPCVPLSISFGAPQEQVEL